MLAVSGRETSAMEQLEARSLLSGSPLPTIANLENPSNTVVRLETNFGDIDIELFNSAAPVTVANFLNYVTSGRYDNTFFHRSAFNDAPANTDPFVLQGGGFRYTDEVGYEKVSTDAAIIRENTGRSNLARTVAMARQNAINSATNQFFINEQDNTFLDPTSSSNGYAVFGRVIQGWDVVQTIEALRIVDFSSFGVLGSVTDASAFNEVPVGPSFTGTNFNEGLLVQLVNAEIIKPSGFGGYFSQQVVMPEGFRSTSTTESVELVNPNSVSAAYQVIVHYEWGNRETVISSGTLSPGATTRLRLSDASDSAVNTVRTGTPYSVTVVTAVPEGTANAKPIGASLNRRDFGAATSEAFFNPSGYSDSAQRTWDFARIERNNTSTEFLTWYNNSENDTTVTVTLLTPGGTQTFNFPVEAYRRGGIALSGRGLTQGVLSARVTAPENIVAYVSDYDLPAAGVAASGAYTPGWGVMGTPDGGSNIGALAGVTIQSNFSNVISIYNPNSTVAAVTFSFWRTSRAQGDNPIQNTQVVFAQSRLDVALDSLSIGIPAGETFSVTYSSGSANITLQYTSVDSVGRNQATGKKADGFATAFTSRMGPETYFTDGYLDSSRTDASLREAIDLFNPYTTSGANLNYTVRYTFSDGSSIDAFTGSLLPNARVQLLTSDAPLVRTKAGQNLSFRNYTISIIATQGSTAVSGVALLTRTDTSLGYSIAQTGMPSGYGYFVGDALLPAG